MVITGTAAAASPPPSAEAAPGSTISTSPDAPTALRAHPPSAEADVAADASEEHTLAMLLPIWDN
eukprot:7707044-Alexandrium_andersonii.AAC.1